jgi:pimeloyl-ACP methyl ester carboxylesterase
VIDGAAHLPTLEQAEAVAAVLRDWLAMPLVLR